MATIGLKNFYYAPLTADSATAVTYGTPVRIPGAVKVSRKTGAAISTLYADDAPFAVASNGTGEITLDFEFAELSLEHKAALLGHTVSKGQMVKKAGDEAPYVAVMFEGAKLATGAKYYVKVLKLKFMEPDLDMETKKESVAFNTPKLTAKAVAREFDGKWEVTADTEAKDYEDVSNTWYASVDPTT